MVTIYKETDSKDNQPDSTWEFWGMRTTPEIEVAVWRKDVTEHDAKEYYMQEMMKNP